VNYSLNQVFMRSVNTSLVVLLPILSLLLFGGDTLKDFAFAMFVGVATGAYSSIYIAAPLLVVFKAREAKYKQLEARRQVRTARERVPAGGAAVSTEAAGDGEAVAAVPVAASSAAATRATARTGGPARPRPKSKRKPPAKKRRR
jgi:SecD/SecF fusion protein